MGKLKKLIIITNTDYTFGLLINYRREECTVRLLSSPRVIKDSLNFAVMAKMEVSEAINPLNLEIAKEGIDYYVYKCPSYKVKHVIARLKEY